jgi:hypothetical protein
MSTVRFAAKAPPKRPDRTSSETADGNAKNLMQLLQNLDWVSRARVVTAAAVSWFHQPGFGPREAT